MKASTIKATNEFVKLIGGHSWVRTATPCTGKWRGTKDYYLVIDGIARVCVSNGMANFEAKILNWMEDIKRFRLKKEEYLQKLKVQAQRDNEIAIREGLHTVRIIDLRMVDPFKKEGRYFPDIYVLMEVNGLVFKHVETNLRCAIQFDELDEYILKRNNRSVHTAGAVETPDYIFFGIRFNSRSTAYKLYEL